MSQKRECPGCKSYTSAIYRAWGEGDPCPYCGADIPPASLAEILVGDRVAILWFEGGPPVLVEVTGSSDDGKTLTITEVTR